MKKKGLSFIFLIAIVSFLNSCVVAVVDYSVSGRFPLQRTFQRSISMKPGGTISLENRSGNIEIRGWNREKLEIFAEEAGSFPVERKVRVYGLGFGEPKISFKSYDDFVEIRTQFPRDDEAPPTHFSLKVPHHVNFKEVVNGRGDISISDIYGQVVLDLEEGEISVENFSGSLEISLDRGNIRVELLDLREEDEIEIFLKEGDILLELEQDVRAQVEAEAPEGNISSDFDWIQPLPAKKVSAQVGEKGARIFLAALHGDINIKKI